MAFTFTREDIDRLCPRPKGGTKAAIWDGYVSALLDMTDEINAAGINTPLLGCHAFAQWGAESGFTLLWESGNYSADRIMAIFGEGRHSANVTAKEAAKIAALPLVNDARAKALFERVYGLGNPKKARELGNGKPGDGYAARGFGIQQITGIKDHQKYGLVGNYSARSAIRAALMEWKAKECSQKAAVDDCRGVTRLINGGYNGLQERQALLRQAKTIWTDNVDEMPVPVVAAALDVNQEHHPIVAAAKSRTVWSLVAAGFTGLGKGFERIVDAASGLLGSATEIQSDAETTAAPIQSILGLLKVDAVYIGTTIAIICLIIAVVRHVDEKKPKEPV